MEAEQVIEKILSDAKVEAEKIIKQKEEQIASEQKAFDKKLSEYEKETDSLAKKAADEKKAHLLAETRMKLAKEILAEKRKIIDGLFEDAKKQLEKLPDEEYKNLMTKLMLKAVQTGSEEVIVGKNETRINAVFLSRINDTLQKKGGKKAELKLSDKKQDINAGFILKRGKIKTNASVNVILEEAKRDLEIELAKDLFS
jgi:V/A-type H+-transporting ATPase subunit E